MIDLILLTNNYQETGYASDADLKEALNYSSLVFGRLRKNLNTQ